VVLKPSPFTPVVTVAMGEVLRDLIPAGVLNVVSGGNELGQWMTEHPVPRGISFTGSIATGKKVNVSAAADLKRVLLELGGNDAALGAGRQWPRRRRGARPDQQQTAVRPGQGPGRGRSGGRGGGGRGRAPDRATCSSPTTPRSRA
jgi:hypothetical protein